MPIDGQAVVAMLVNGRGDYLMSLPTLRALSDAYPNRLVLVTGKGASANVLHEIDRVRTIEIPHVKDELGPVFEARTLAREIGPCELFVSLNPWHNGSMRSLIGALHAATTVGYHPDFDIELPLDFSRHSMDLMFDAIGKLSPGATLERWASPPVFAEIHRDAARHIVSLLPDDSVVLGLQGDTLHEKRWTEKGFDALVRWFLSRFETGYILDLGFRPALGTTMAEHERYIHCGKLILPVAFELVDRVDLFVGVDSCFLHAADLMRKPGVALFGPTDPHEFGFRLARPCRHVKQRAMSDITPTSVILAAEQVLAEAGMTAPCRVRRQ